MKFCADQKSIKQKNNITICREGQLCGLGLKMFPVKIPGSPE